MALNTETCVISFFWDQYLFNYYWPGKAQAWRSGSSGNKYILRGLEVGGVFWRNLTGLIQAIAIISMPSQQLARGLLNQVSSVYQIPTTGTWRAISSLYTKEPLPKLLLNLSLFKRTGLEEILQISNFRGFQMDSYS